MTRHKSNTKSRKRLEVLEARRTRRPLVAAIIVGLAFAAIVGGYIYFMGRHTFSS